MSDVEIVFPKGREAAVRRLQDALAEAGYDVAGCEVGEGDRASAASDASAVLILWDRSTMAHPGLQAAAAAARKRDRAIDVSVDGITPLNLDDDRKLVQLSGWRGDAHHPGWRKILARLEELCSRRAAPSARTATAPLRTEARMAGTGDEGRARSGAGRALLAAGVGILAIVVALAALMMSRRPQAPRPPAQNPPSAAAPSAAAPKTASVAPSEATAAPDEAAQPVQPPVAVPSGPTPQSTTTMAGEAAVPPAARSAEANQIAPAATARAPTQAKARRPKPTHDTHRPAIRYTRYSKTMRLFCQRTGRGTPQCRIFEAATGQ